MSTEASESANPETGAISLFDAVAAMHPDSPPEEQPEVATEEAPDAEPVESTEEATAEPEAAEPEAGPAETESEEPQHLTLDEYGELTIPVKIGGEEKRVSLADAAKGYQLEADYRRKTQAMAEERKAFEAEQAAFAEQTQQLQQQYAAMLARQVGEPPDPALASEDPFAYIEAKAKYEAKVSEMQQVQAAAQAHRAQEQQAMIQRETAALIERAPEFKDPQHAAAFAGDIVTEFGFQPEEVAATIDHRILLLAADALKWRKSQKAAPKVAKAVSKPAKVIKPGAAKTSADVKREKAAAAARKLNRPGGVSIDEYLDAKYGSG